MELDKSGKRLTPEKLISLLTEAELFLIHGSQVADVRRKLGITEQSDDLWRKKYGGMRADQARRLKELEQENARLKKLTVDLPLDHAILKEVNGGPF